MSEETVVQFGAPTLAGIKTGSLFSCLYDTKAGVYEDVRRLNRVLTPRGLCLLPLRFGEKRVLMYLFRPSGLETDLRCRGARRILRDAGYDDASMGKCMRCLIRRLRESESFPHEIGLFLSYPPEDVRGFIENKPPAGPLPAIKNAQRAIAVLTAPDSGWSSWPWRFEMIFEKGIDR